jgi:two-component sensor histidine kinase
MMLPLRLQHRSDAVREFSPLQPAHRDEFDGASKSRTLNERYFELFDGAPVGYLTVNESGFIVELNRRAAALLALDSGAPQGHRFESLVAAEDQNIYCKSRRVLFETRAPQVCEVRLVAKQPSCWVHLEMALEKADRSGACRIAIVDITRSKTVELKCKERELHLQRLLVQNNTKTREMYHRVKNNLQVIGGLLRLQSEIMQDDNATHALHQCHLRIRSMALIHERLYADDARAEVDLGDLTKSLVGEVFKAYGSPQGVRCRMRTRPVLLHPDQAIPCGLIVNELVTNAFKHAYPKGTAGEIRVDLKETAAGFIKLTVSDRGVGLPSELDVKNSDSMGCSIVDALVKQIGGKLIVKRSPGASFRVEFPRRGGLSSRK